MSAVFPIENKARYGKYTATAGQTLFSIPFEFQQNADVKVRKTLAAGGDPVVLTLTTDYTVAGAGVYNGGSFTLVAAAAAGDILEVWGAAILDRTSSVVQNGVFSSKTQDDEHDRHRIIQQELARDADRSIKRPLGKAGFEMGDITPGHFPKMNADGDGFEDGGDADDIINAQAAAATAVAAAAQLTNLSGVTDKDAARANIDLGSFKTSSGGVVSEINMSGSARIRVTASSAPANRRVYEQYVNASDGDIVEYLLSDDLSIRQAVRRIKRSDKIYYDFDYVHPDDVSVSKTTLAAGGGTGGGYLTLEVDKNDAPVNSGAIRGVNGDPAGTLEWPASSGDVYGAAGTPGVTHTSVPGSWLPHDISGNFDGTMGNTPSNAKMSDAVIYTTELFRIEEKCGGSGCNRGLTLGMMKDYDRLTKLLDTDNCIISQSLEDASLDIMSRNQTAAPKAIKFWVGASRAVTIASDKFVGINTPTPSRRFHVVATSSLTARFEAQAASSLIEYDDTAQATSTPVRAGSAGDTFVAQIQGTTKLEVKSAGISVAGGATVKPDFITVSLDPPSIASGSSAVVTTSFPGVVANTSPVFLSGDTASSSIVPAGTWASATDVVSQRFRNGGGSPVDLADRSYQLGRL